MTLANGIASIWWAVQSLVHTITCKWIFSAALFDYPYTILAVQSFSLSACLLAISISLKREIPQVRFRLCGELAGSVLFFFLYAYSNARALRFISLPAFTTVKSFAPLGIILVERTIFGNPFPSGFYYAAVLATVGNFLTFESASSLSLLSRAGYAWALLNVVSHVLYILSLRYWSGTFPEKALQINLYVMVFYIPMIWLNNEPFHLVRHIGTLSSSQVVPLVLCCLLGAGCAVTALSAARTAPGDGMHYLHLFSATNRIFVVSLGAYIFRTQLSVVGWVGVSFAVLSGFIFISSKTPSTTYINIPRSPTLELLLPNWQVDITESESENKLKERI